jgi:hypothetical protein
MTGRDWLRGSFSVLKAMLEAIQKRAGVPEVVVARNTIITVCVISD